MQTRFLAIALFAACSDDPEVCNPVDHSGCEDGNVCEAVVGSDTPKCFAPVQVHGKVTDVMSGGAIAGARVVALDVNGAAASNVAVTSDSGDYVLPIPTPRTADGTPTTLTTTLRADAANYQTFPSGTRVALPIDVAAATKAENEYVVKSAVTDIGLFAQPGGGGDVHGKVEIPADRPGVIVVAEKMGIGHAGIVSRDGQYTILNLDAGRYTVTAYAKGHVYAPVEIDVAGSTALDLKPSDAAAAMLSGSIQIVNGGGNSTTSVVLFVASTFDSTTGRGVQPPGLRAPDSGAPNVTGSFSIAGVPPGRYAVVAAFENDNLVRDPDVCISGTADVFVDVAAGQPVTVPDSFKITEALAVRSPGAEGAELVTAAPTLVWADDSSEQEYLVEVFDALGNLAWSTTVPGGNGDDVSVAYAGPMTAGMYYQWRVTSIKDGCNKSRTEDLRGVFIAP